MERRADLAYAAGVALGVVFLLLVGPLDRRLELVHINDFSGFWAGGRALLLGIDPYAPAGWYDAAVAMGTQPPDTGVYGYTPWVAIAMVALAAIPLEAAAWLWMIVTVGIAIVALRALLRAYLPARPLEHGIVGGTLLLCQPGISSFVLGQWSFALLAAAAGAAVALRAHRPRLAALAMLTFLAKPQLFVFAALRILSHRAAAAVAVPLGLAIVAVSVALLPHWLETWVPMAAAPRIVRNASLPVALGDILGQAGPLIGYALIVAGLGVALSFGLRSDASLAVWLALSAAGTLYSWSYDHLELLVPVVVGAGVLAADRPRRSRLVVLGSCATLLVLSPLFYALAVARHRESFSAFIPVAIFVLLAWALWPYRRSAPPAGR